MSSSAMDSVRGSIRPCSSRLFIGHVAPAALAGEAAGDFGGAVAPRPLPRRRRSAGAPVQLLVDRPGRRRRVAGDAEVDPVVRAERVRVEVDLDHGRVVADERAVPQRPHVQRAAPADQQVGVLDQVGRDRGGEAAADVETERRVAEQAARDGGGGKKSPRTFGQMLYFFSRISSAPAGEKDRPAGGGQGVGERGDRLAGRRGERGRRHGGQGERRRGARPARRAAC